MSERRVGKPSPSRLQALLGDHFGAPSPCLIVAPGPGLDAAILDLEDGRVMAIAEDPIFPAPGLPLDLMGWFTVHIGASDVAVTGVRPQFMTYTLLLPPTCPESDAQTIVASISDAARELGICIVGGHTGWYDAVTIPTVGGVTVWGMADKSAWVSPGGARDGDALLMTKGPAIEAVALLSVLYKERLRNIVSAESLERALSRTGEISVVQDARLAFEIPGVHAMHDATEGGVLGGIFEMATAAGMAARVDLDAVSIPPDISQVAKALDFDPWRAISEGTLLVAAAPESVDQVLENWRKNGIEGHVIGRFDASGRSEIRLRQETSILTEPETDPFWDLFFAGLGQLDKEPQ
jgi:hydrogenase maturation factor